MQFPWITANIWKFSSLPPYRATRVLDYKSKDKANAN